MIYAAVKAIKQTFIMRMDECLIDKMKQLLPCFLQESDRKQIRKAVDRAGVLGNAAIAIDCKNKWDFSLDGRLVVSGGVTYIKQRLTDFN